MERSDNKFNKEWKDRMAREMLRFNGKSAGIGDENSVSDATSEGKKSQRMAAALAAGKPKSALKTQPSNLGNIIFQD